MTRIAAIAAAATTCVALGVGFWFAFGLSRGHSCVGGVVAGEAQIGGPFELVRHDGVTVSDTDVITGPSLVYFGYTFCPDVCPLDANRNAEAVDLLAQRGFEVTPVFITIDPARDTPEALNDFVTYTHDSMIGLTGSQEQINAAIRGYKAYARKVDDSEYYLMDHSAHTYLMNPDGFLAFFRRGVSAEDMANVTECFIEQAA